MTQFRYPSFRLIELDLDPDKLSKGEAKRFYDQFVSLSAPRVEVLRQAYVATTGRPTEDLDESPESLEPLWTWATAAVSARKPTETEIKARRGHLSTWIQSLVKRGAAINANDAKKLEMAFELNGQELTSDTKTIALDVGFYFAAVLMQRFPDIKWHMESRKKYTHYNKPTLALFPEESPSPHCDPYSDVSRSFAQFLKESTDKNLLMEQYRRYETNKILHEKNRAIGKP